MLGRFVGSSQTSGRKKKSNQIVLNKTSSLFCIRLCVCAAYAAVVIVLAISSSRRRRHRRGRYRAIPIDKLTNAAQFIFRAVEICAFHFISVSRCYFVSIKLISFRYTCAPILCESIDCRCDDFTRISLSVMVCASARRSEFVENYTYFSHHFSTFLKMLCAGGLQITDIGTDEAEKKANESGCHLSYRRIKCTQHAAWQRP